MNKFTKVLASFCAASMIFGTMSANVFANSGTVTPNQAEDYSSTGFKEPEDSGEDFQIESGSKIEVPISSGAPLTLDQGEQELPPSEPKPDDLKAPLAKAEPVDQGADQPAVQGADQPVNQPVDQPVDQPVNPEIEPVPAKVPISVNQQYINNNGYQMPVTSGTYMLKENITVTNCAYAETADQDITIDLNGHTITYVGSENLYVLGKVRGVNGDGTGALMTRVTGVSLTIKDSGSTGLITTGEGYNGSGNTDYWINDTGVGKDTGRGGCILIENGCFLVLNGGTISGFKAVDDGGAIHVGNGGSFTMNGGKITNCSAGQGGGGIAVHASSKPKYKPDESISLRGSLVINGGEISGNTANNQGGGVRALRGDMEINGGVIENNICKSGTGSFGGGGVAVSKGNVSPVMKISGNPKIENNTCTANPKRNNIYFFDGITLSLGGALSPEAKIGFASDTNIRTMKYFNTSGNSYALTSFFCDDSDYKPVENKGYIMLTNTVPQVDGYRLIAGGEIILETTISLGNADISDVIATAKYSYKKSGEKKDVIMTYATADFEPSGDNYTFRIPVESACMTAPITVTLDYTIGGSNRQYKAKAVTIEDYAKAIKNGNYQTYVKDVAKALINFGGYAQVQFDINTDKLPTLYGVDYENTEASYGLTGNAFILNDTDGLYAGATVSMLSKTDVKLRFKKSKLGDIAPELKVTYGSASPVYIAADENLSTGNYYVYVIKGPKNNGFYYTNYDATFDFEIGTASGTYSIYTYLQAIKDGSTNPAMVNLAEAYYNFAEACQAAV